MSGPRTAYLFFPLWLGYVLVVDAFVCLRSGSSLWTRQRGGFVLLFILSAPAWWLFELLNNRTGNWQYLGASSFTPLQHYALCTLSFSTVMPAVFETAELARTFSWIDSFRRGRKLAATPRLWPVLFFTGIAMLTFTLLWPQRFYAFMWISIWLILEPINHKLHRPHLFAYLQQGDWRPQCRWPLARSSAASSGKCGTTGPGRNGCITRRASNTAISSKCPCSAMAVTSPSPSSFTP